MRIRKSLVAGAFAVAVVIAVVAANVGWRYLKPRFDTISVTAQFESVSGLYVGNSVSVLGMPVGKVTGITLRGGYADVELSIDRSVKVPADVQAVTVSTSILTDRHIELTPPYRGGRLLQNNDTIGLLRTKTPIEFDRVLTMLDKLSKSLRGDGKGQGPVADILDNSAATVSGNGERMRSAADELSKALQLTSSDGGAMTREQLTTIIKNTSSLFDAAANNDATLREFGSDVRKLSQIVADEDLGSGTAGHKLNTIIEKTGAIVERNRDNFKQSVQSGNTAMGTIVDYKRGMAEILDLLPLVAENIYNSIDQNNGLLRGHVLLDKAIFDSQFAKEVCNMMKLRQLGCSTGTLQDYGPDFGLTYVLDGLAAMGQK